MRFKKIVLTKKAMLTKKATWSNQLEQAKKTRAQAGFTLIEVMVALMVVAIVLPALLMQIGGMATSAAQSRDRSMAYWIAENKLQDIYITRKLQNTLPRGRQSDNLEMADRKWEWETESEVPPGAEGALRIRIKVRLLDTNDDLVEISGIFIE